MTGDRETRVALIIGNSRYHHACPLKNPKNDAKAIGRALGRVNFIGANPQLNLSYDDFRRALHDFARLADSADMAVIYFAGHGLEVNEKNFLIPVDAKLEKARDAEYEGITLDQVLTSVDGARLLKLIILDACRNNPFRARMRQSVGIRSIGKGLRAIEPHGNVLVAYAAKHGTYAQDGDGDNSPYVQALLSHIETPGLEIGKLFREVRDDVLERTGQLQEPYTYGSLGRRDIYIVPPLVPKSPEPPPSPGPDVSRVVSPIKPWQKVSALAAAFAGLLILWSVMPSPGDKPQPVIDHNEVRKRDRTRDWKKRANQQGRDADVARAELGKLGFIPINVKRIDSVDRQWIKPGGGKDDSESFQDCWGPAMGEGQCGPIMVLVPSGKFLMGSPANEAMRNGDEDDKPGGGGERVWINFSAPFAVGKFEISFAQWNACLSNGGCNIGAPAVHGEKADQPAVSVSWTDITGQYLPWLNRKVSGKADGPYRLLSEAEWEYVARAGAGSAYWFGDIISADYARFGSSTTVPVDGLLPNPWGLHNVHGNVWEWVNDCYSDSYSRLPGDGTSSPEVPGSPRVARGGSYTNGPADLRSAKRLSVASDSRTSDIGFRVARALSLNSDPDITPPPVRTGAFETDKSRF